MSSPVLRRAALLSFILLCAAVESPPRAPAAQGAAPETMQGVYRYKVRGLTAGAGMFSSMFFKAPGMYAATVGRVVPGFFKILGGMAKVSNDPSAKEMHAFLRSGDLYGMNYSTIPVAAGYGIEIEFTLEQVKKEWQLKRGSYRWSSDHHWKISAGGGSIVENVRGQGEGVLDPKTSSITMVETGKKGSRRMELAGNISITSGFVAGKSVYTNGPMRWAVDHGRGEVEIVMGGLAAVRDKLPGGGDFGVSNFSFSKSVSPEMVKNKAIRGREVYQDLLDSGVVEEWELWSKCEAWITDPADNAELVFDDRKTGRLVQNIYAGVRPTFWEDDLHWDLPQIEGSTLDTPPEKANGNDFEITYTNLPEKNSAFKRTEVKARFDTDRARRAGCKDPEPAESVGYFYNRSALNHGGLPGLKARGNADLRPNPNWLHYWMQTKANVGLPWHKVRYGAEAGTCQTALAYYPPGEKHIVVCDPGSFTKQNPWREVLYGIDYFAALLLHEKQHHDDYWRWWAAGHDITLDSDPVNPKANWRGKAGLPGDWIPDLVEHMVPVPPQIKARKGAKFSPNRQDSFGYKLDDEHYLAYAAEFQWRVGAADKEDWSCPGKQTLPCGIRVD